MECNCKNILNLQPICNPTINVSEKCNPAVNITANSQGTLYHDRLMHREYQDQHPISAITGLEDAIEGINSAIGSQGETISGHIANKNNPHEVTKSQVGLGNVDNTSDADKPISTATQTALDGKANKATTLAGYGITDAYNING